MGHKIEQISLALTNHCFGILVELTIVSNSKGKFCSKHLENCAGNSSKMCKFDSILPYLDSRLFK